MFLGYVADQFENQEGFTHAGPAEEAHLAALHVGSEQIHDLDAGLEYLGGGDLVHQGRRRAVDGQGSGGEVLEAALMDTGKPILIVPQVAPAAFPGTVVIAWKDTPEAARAVNTALPLIDKAERVVIMGVVEAAESPQENAVRLQRSLKWHNPNTVVQVVKREGRPAVEVLLAEAKALGAGVVVMGGYSHSRLREVVFGGFTQRVLAGADVAVLMAH